MTYIYNIILRNRFINLLILLMVCMQIHGQSVYLFDSKKGLSNSQIQTIYEDSRHNIWITTRNGLNRYDGAKINSYHHSDDDSNSLLNDLTTCVYEFDNSTILIGTDAGLQAYDYATDKFTYIPYITMQGDTVGSVHIIGITKLKDGHTYGCIAAYGAMTIERDKDGKLVSRQTTKFNTGNDLSPVRIFQDSHNDLWVINMMGEIYRMIGDKKVKIEGAYGARKLCESSSGNLYLCSINKLSVYSKKDNTFKQISDEAKDYNLWSISPWTDGRIFICTDGNGILVYDEKTGSITQSPIQVSDFDLSTSNVKDVLNDSFGSVWIGIYWKGVMQKPSRQSAFEYVGRLSITKNTIGQNSITSMVPDSKGNIWIATDNNGLYNLSADGNNSTHWNPAKTANMPSTINAICDDSENGRVWLGSYSSGLHCMNISTGTVTTPNKNIIRVFDIKKDSKNNLWVASMGNGVFHYSPSSGKMLNYSTTPTTVNGVETRIDNKYTSCITVQGNKLYIGSPDGFTIYKLDKNDVPISEKKFLGTYYINDIKIHDNHIWVATNKGLAVYDAKTYTSELYNVSKGLPNNMINSIEFDGNNVWVSTDNGLACFDRKTKQFHNFFADDGLQDNEFGIRASLKIGNTLYFGGISGLNFFTNEDIKSFSSSKNFKLKITDLYVNGKQIYSGDMSDYYTIIDSNIDDASVIHLSHNEKQFSLQLAALGLGYNHAIYEYSLDGEEWIVQSEQSNTLVFANLKTGTHKLLIRARTFQATSDIREITIIQHQAWYFSTVALIIYFILFVLLIWLAYVQATRQITARRILARHKQEEEMNEARIQFFMNISHEIRTPMTLIFAPLEKLMSTDKDEEHQRSYRLMHQNSKRIMRLINQMMDARKIEKGQYKLDFRPVEVVDFLQSICDVFSTTAQNRGITFDYNHSVDKLYAKADPENLDKILMNLLSNAFKFTPDNGKINLSLTTEDGKMIIKVTDTGTGIPNSEKSKVFERFYSGKHQNGYIGTGIGLNLTYLIVNMHNGNITVEDNPEGQGTQFTVSLPLIDVKASAVEEIQAQAENQELPVSSASEESVALPIEKLKGMRHRNVLVVEDDAAIRSYIHSELSTHMVITEFGNGQEAWDYLIQNPTKVDLIISDVMMPVMDGLSLCQKIKQNFNTSHLPVILITALGTDTDRINGINTGADAYVTKPFNIDVLRSTAVNLLTSRLALQGKWSTSQKTENNIEKREIESADEHLLTRVIKVIDENMEDPELSVEIIADKVGISRVHFYRKMKELTGQSPRDFLKTVRLKEAARLLSEKHLDITSVCAATGFKTLSTFSTSFKSVYGVSPSEYSVRERNKDE